MDGEQEQLGTSEMDFALAQDEDKALPLKTLLQLLQRVFSHSGGCECQIGVASSSHSSTNLVGMVTFLPAQSKGCR